MLIGLVLVFIQTVPLPLQKIKLLSPEAFTSYKRAFDIIGGNFQEWLPLSLYPYATKIEWFKLLTYVAFFELVFHRVTEKKDLQRLMFVWAVIGIFEGFYGLFQVISGTDRIWWWENPFYKGMGTGTFIYHNHFGTYMAMVFPLLIGYLFNEIGSFIRRVNKSDRDSLKGRLFEVEKERTIVLIFLGLAIFIAGIGFSLSASRGGMIACAIALVFASSLLCIKKNTRIYGAALLVLFGLFLAYAIFATSEKTIDRFADSSGNFKGRLELTKSSWQMSEKYSLTGSGWGTFEEVFRRYKGNGN